MMSLEVTRKTIAAVLESLKNGNWKVPAFQREYVWKQSQVFALVDSIFRSRPIGLLTLWAQPPGNPHTKSMKLKLRYAEYGEFDNDPPQLALILDGRQRLTSLAIVFGGLREQAGNMLFSGTWFLDLDKDPALEEIVVYKKKGEVQNEQLDNVSQCVARGLFPLHHHAEIQSYLGHIHDPSRYPENGMPDAATIALRAARLAQYSRTFIEFQIPVAELPQTVSLAEVCEIFDVLNQTGTRVSTFDLLHNIIFADTEGQFELRSSLAQWSTDLQNLGMLCSEDRPDFFCQMVTGCYLSENNPQGRRPGSTVSSVKGGDLLETPTSFYQKFQTNISAVDSYCSTLFSNDVLGLKARLKDIPYPASIILFLSLSWARDLVLPEGQSFSPSRLARLFKAFYWSNVFSTRYDQGFLTQFAKDRKILHDILTLDIQSDNDWVVAAERELDIRMFTGQNKRRTKEELREFVMDGNLRGAVADGIKLFLFSRVKYDLTDGQLLDRFHNEQAQRVDLHHIYPTDWCKNNAATYPILTDPDRSVQASFANLVPLRADSNRTWKTKEPRTALDYFGINVNDANVKQRFMFGFVDQSALDALQNSELEQFWEARSDVMATELHKLQYIGQPPDLEVGEEM